MQSTAQKMPGSSRIDSLDTSAFSRDDALNLVLQRSQIIDSKSARNRSISAWVEGEHQPLLDLIDSIGTEELVKRAAGLIYSEYEALRPILDAKPPAEISDIGCGYGFFDLFLAQDYDCKVNLIDLESSDNRHFGFEDSGAAYSNLDTARAFLASNGIAKKRIKTFNPSKNKLTRITKTDLAVSFLSCGFHYPWSTYAVFFRDAVVPGGRILLDIRKRKSAEAVAQLAAYGDVQVLPNINELKANTVLVEKLG
ncbi:class I SAM-dependent methyltransferase [Tateyamaria armeniaca]|uniref:Class I SAM-dependent methyltransferase n=1 Tax=Tateyamaria armeniaca TaxID=2518930 RepID=A0ABW8UVJ0_9RHOB